MPVADDSGVVGARGGIGPIEPGDRIGDSGEEAVLDCTVDQQVVRGYARLPGVEVFSPDDTAGRLDDIDVILDDTGALAPQLEGYRGRAFGRGLHDEPSDPRRAGIEDIVKPFLQQAPGHLRPSLDAGNVGGIKRIGDKPRQDVRGVQRDLGGFEDGGVSRRDCPHQRGQEELDRVIPRRDDKGRAVRLGIDEALRVFMDRGVLHPPGPGPFSEAPHDERDIGEYDAELGGVGLHRRLPEIGVKGLQNLALTGYERGLQEVQLSEAK